MNLRIEGLLTAVAVISEPFPRFSFLHSLGNTFERGTTQASYRLTVVQRGVADIAVWDSGVVVSANCSEIEYAGSALQPFSRYTWTAQFTTSNGTTSEVAAAAFETGPLAESDWQGAAALAGPTTGTTQYRLSFTLDAPVEWGRAYIAAAGCHHLEINGGVPAPNLRGVCPWPATPSKHMRFQTRDVTGLVRVGENVLGLLGGNVQNAPSVVAVFALTMADGSRRFITTADKGWRKRTVSYVTQGTAYSTTIDWTKHDPAWSRPGALPAPGAWEPASTVPAALPPRALGMPLSVVLGQVTPIEVRKVRAAAWLYTFPRNFVGTVKLAPLPLAANGSQISVLAGEWLNQDPLGPARCRVATENGAAHLGGCDPGHTISEITFASYGTPKGTCGGGSVIKSEPSFTADPNCDAAASLAHVKSLCEGKADCVVEVHNADFGGDPCTNTSKHFAAVVRCDNDEPGSGPLPAPSVPAISGGQQQYQNHVLRHGNPTPLETLFCWHGFQYALVTSTGNTGFDGRIGALVGLEIRTNVSSTGALQFGGPSSALLNGLNSMARNSQLANVAAYMPTDCPTREKKGWLGDALDAAEQALYNFEMRAVHEAFLQTIEDNQGAGGDIPVVVPQVNEIPGPNSCQDIAWTAAFPQIIHFLHLYYGDVRAVRRHWPALQRYTQNLINNAATSPNDLAVCDQFKDWLCGVNSTSESCCSNIPANSSCPVPQEMGGFNYVLVLRAMAGMATLLGHGADAANYTALAAGATAAFHRTFFNPALGRMGGDLGAVQSLTVPALAIGSAPTPELHDQLVQQLAADVAAPGIGQPA